jgi:hypothetical protein
MPRRKQDEALTGPGQETAAKESPRQRGRRAGGKAAPRGQARPSRERAHADLLTVACAPRGVRCESPNALVTQ